MLNIYNDATAKDRKWKKLAMIGVSAVMQDVNWLVVGSASLLAGILSVLTSILYKAQKGRKPLSEFPEN